MAGIFNPMSFGAAGDDAADDAAAIQAAINAAAAAGPGSILEFTQRHAVGASSIVSSGDVWLRGNGGRLRAIGAGSIDCLAIQGVLVDPITTVVAPGANQSDMAIPVADASPFSVGDIIRTNVTSPWQHLQMNKVRAVSPGQIVVTLPFMTPIPAGTQVRKLSAVSRVRVSDLAFVNGGSGALTRGLKAERTVALTVENLSGEGFATGAAFYLKEGLQTRVAGIRTIASGSAAESDFEMTWQAMWSARDIVSLAASGFGPQFAFCYAGVAESIVSVGAASRGLKINACIENSFRGLHGHNSGSTGIAVSGNSQRNRLSGVHANANRGVPGNAVGLWFADQADCDNEIDGVFADGNGTYNIAFFATDLRNVARNVRSSHGSVLIQSPSDSRILFA